MGGGSSKDVSSTASSFPSVREQLKEDCVVVVSMLGCGWCEKAKDLLTDMGVQHRTVQIDDLGGKRGAFTQELMQMTGRRTLPQIFIAGNFVGGYSEIEVLQRTGQLLTEVSKCKQSCVS